MPRELFRHLAVVVLLVPCASVCARAGDGAASGDQEPVGFFEESSPTAASSEGLGSGLNFADGVAIPPAANGATDLSYEAAPGARLIAGVDATFFRASAWGLGVGSAVTNAAGPTAPSMGVSTTENFYTISPRIYAGVQDDCWAILGRFWYLSESSDEFQPFLPPPGSGDGSSAFERLKAYTLDLELSRAINLGASKVHFFLGGRYASFETAEAIEVSRLTNPTEMVYTSAASNFSFDGPGVTTGFWGVTPIGDTQLNFLWGMRGSVLWGTFDRGAQTMASIVGVSGGSSIDSAFEQDHDTAFILEGLLGVQWDHQLRRLPMSAFLRIAAEYQYWDLGSNGQAASTSLAVSPANAAVSKSFVGDVDAQFIGFTVGVGLTW